MIELVPCVVCRRHVAVTEAACPFCRTALPDRAAQAFATRRLSRAAVFVAGVALAACGGNKKEIQTHPASSDAGVSTAAAADAAQPTPPHDEVRQRHNGGGGCTSPGNGQPPVCMPYGAPPARRRVV